MTIAVSSLTEHLAPLGETRLALLAMAYLLVKHAIADYFPHKPELFSSRRVMHRITVEGDRPA